MIERYLRVIPIKQRSFEPPREVIGAAVNLQPVNKDGFGECIEIDFPPENLRQLALRNYKVTLTIRRVEQNKWCIWRNA